LNLPKDRPLLLFGALNVFENLRKGFGRFRAALQSLEAHPDAFDVVVFGASRPEDPPDLRRTFHYLGRLHDHQTLALVYSAADAMVVPSIQEAFGQTVIEAMACETPVVAFRATGPQSIVDHKRTGYLAEPYRPDALAAGIQWMLESDERRSALGETARQVVTETYSAEESADAYRRLYQSICK
jgi:glycosyltransferase involved in cell wall biosynthesis